MRKKEHAMSEKRAEIRYVVYDSKGRAGYVFKKPRPNAVESFVIPAAALPSNEEIAAVFRLQAEGQTMKQGGAVVLVRTILDSMGLTIGGG